VRPETLFAETSRPLSSRELRWLKLKIRKTRGALKRKAFRSIVWLGLALPLLLVVSIPNVSVFGIVVSGAICLFAVMSLHERFHLWRKVGGLEKRVGTGTVHELRIVSSRCFRLNVTSGTDDEDENSMQYIFDLGEQGCVKTHFETELYLPLPADLGTGAPISEVTDLENSLNYRFPCSDFVVARIELGGKCPCTWVRCRGQKLTPVKSLFFGSYDGGFEIPAYDTLVVIPKSFDDCLNEIMAVK